MNALEWASRKIVFTESSPITGRFDISKYRMLHKPLLALTDIRIKRLTCYKASSALGTVFLQTAVAFWLDQRSGSIQLACQSDDDGTDFMKTRGRKWFSRIPGISQTISNDKYATTNSLWLWPSKFLLVTGPGENAQQAKQVTHFVSDESHVEAFGEGSLAAFEERMSKRWNRMGLHVSTAANEGKEVDRFYKLGQQNEFHLCCPKCHKLTWGLWEDDAKAFYNGETVFKFNGDDVTFVCPHCSASYKDESRERFSLHQGSDYIAMNPDASIENQSFRWNCFAAWWVPWAEQLSKWREALEAAKLGNLGPHENFVKKRLCQSYKPEIPNTGDAVSFDSYKVGDVWITNEPKRRFCSFDYQEGRGGEGIHWWGLASEFTANGNTRVVNFAKLLSWSQCRAFQIDNGVADPVAGESPSAACDYGHRDREVFRKCAEYRWLAMKSADNEESSISFVHSQADKRTGIITAFHLPYSEPQIQTATGVMPRTIRVRSADGSTLAPGLCISRTWSKAAIGFMLLRLIQNKAGRTHGIPVNISQDFVSQINSYIEAAEPVKKYSLTMRRVLRRVRVDDHAFACASQNLVLAAIAGFYPLAALVVEPEAVTE